MGTVFLDGEFVAADAARISPFDRGFLFGDGVYEVIPCYGGRPLRLAAHLERLARSLAAVRIDGAPSATDWARIVDELLARNGGRDNNDGNLAVYLQVTRGTALRRDHAFPVPAPRPTLFATATPMPRPPVDDGAAAIGTAVITASDIRWTRADVKAITLLPNVLLRQRAAEAGARECLFIRDGHVLEGAASNLFIVRDGVLQTPPLSHYLLAGITRAIVLELARQQHLPCVECDLDETALRAADEVWLTSSIREIVPVTRIDDRPVGSGAVGPHWQRMAQAFRELKRAVARGEA